MSLGKRCSQAADDAADGRHKGKHGGKGKHHPPSCSKCCSRFGKAGADGKARCACKGESISCANPSQCCSRDCRNGVCTACPPNTVFCPDGCANLQTDNDHCGRCDHACDFGQRCQDGKCVCDEQSCGLGCCGGPDGTTCLRGTSDQACGFGGATCRPCDTCMTCDGTQCVHATACCGDNAVCQGGGCVDCAAGQRCERGECVCDDQSCPDGCCAGTTCVPVDQQSALQCGAGGAACQGCRADACCAGACVDLQTDPLNCGGCGKPCPVNEFCSGGACKCGTFGHSQAPFTCCPNDTGSCERSGVLQFIVADTCEPVDSCPAGYATCIGTGVNSCQACCPAGTTCDQAGGFCLQGGATAHAARQDASTARGRRKKRGGR